MRRRSGEWEQSGRSGPTRPPDSVLAGPFYLAASSLVPACGLFAHGVVPGLHARIVLDSTWWDEVFFSMSDRRQLRARSEMQRMVDVKAQDCFWVTKGVREHAGDVPG